MAIRKFILFAALLLVSILSTAQDKPRDDSGGVKGFVAGGYVYNSRENDHGAWFEVGGSYRRFELAGNFSRMADAPWNFHEAQALARFSLSRSVALESGYGWGMICNPTGSCGGPWNNVRTRTPFAGIMYLTPISRRMEAVVRMDVTTHWQLPPTKGKDDGLPRFYIGVRFGR